MGSIIVLYQQHAKHCRLQKLESREMKESERSRKACYHQARADTSRIQLVSDDAIEMYLE
jgi:hypothetical protein